MGDSNKLGKSSLSFGLMTMVSRVFGYSRDMVCAYLFGAGAAYDAFIIAFRIPNLLRRLFAEGAFSQAFIPVLSEYQAIHGHKKSKVLISKVATNLLIVLSVVILLGMIFAPQVVLLVAPGFSSNPEKFAMASTLLRVTFPYILLISLTAFVGSVLNCQGKFAEAAFAPALLNIAMILSAIFMHNKFAIPVMSLAWGVLFGGVAQLLFLLPRLYKVGLFPRFNMDWKDPGVKKILLLMGPAIIGASAGQINSVIDSLFASTLVTGSISWLYYADRLMELPLGVFGVGIVTVLLPKLSRTFSTGNQEEYDIILDWGIRMVFLVGVPATLGLLLLSEPLICSLFMYGQFDEVDVISSSQALMAYSFAVLGIMLTKILSSASYARQNIKTPVKISFIAVCLNLVLNMVLIKSMQHNGLALATSIASLFNALLLAIFIIREKYFNFQPGWLKFIMKIVLANIAMVVFLTTQLPPIDTWLATSRSDNVIQLLYFVVGGAIIYTTCILASSRFSYRALFFKTV
ncbi:MAG: murein biosynthesis integral membrane protein MurJ [Francisellaceae bacterium]|nr:murein biosynthesis integral membrane protein MurJ [Francisellaceae bacterium]MBT6206659.1 murein biosynthesis integral membrane protein MurJ [Francisellaceae bacterium]MBT6538628.1 murein biosynthesis integral membrane protein MurJ [Francisellaceae bacterium]